MYMTLKYAGDHHKHDNIGSYTSMPVQAELHIILLYKYKNKHLVFVKKGKEKEKEKEKQRLN